MEYGNIGERFAYIPQVDLNILCKTTLAFYSGRAPTDIGEATKTLALVYFRPEDESEKELIRRMFG